ncbi:MAG: substrate-binding domain-containing protein [Chlorobiaceae bacterium]
MKLVSLLPLLFSMLILGACSGLPEKESARSGRLVVAADRQLSELTSMQAEFFSRYYTDARVSLSSSESAKTLAALLEGKAGAALIDGELLAREDSLFATFKRPLLSEPVARDGIVFIVNRGYSSKKLSLGELGALFSDSPKGVTPLVSADNYRMLGVFASRAAIRRSDLRVSACKSDLELLERVASDKRFVGLMFRSSFEASRIAGGAGEAVRLLPLAARSGDVAFFPSRQAIFDGSYPLVTTVSYVYYPGDALAAGFGAWLGSRGQKLFESSQLVPVRQMERTVNIK